MAQPSYDRQTQYQQQVLQMPETLNSLSNIGSMNQKPKQSRLELMRQNYEKKRQKDVEDRLAEMRAQEVRTGSGKQANGGGTVRSFFAERRAMEANVKDPYALPPIDRHFKKVKDSSSSAPPRQTRNAHEPYVPPAKSNSAGRRRAPPQYHRKKSKGVDKQNPLPPLQRVHSNSHKPPTPNKRYETHNTLMSDNTETEQEQQHQQIQQQQQMEQKRQQQQKLHQQQQQQKKRLEQQRQLEQQEREQQQTVHVPQPPQQPNPLRGRNIDSRSDFDETSSNYSEEPPPNLTKLKALRQKRLSKQMSLVKQESVEKPTDFQKWQMEQDRERAERLETHRQKIAQQQDHESEVTLSMRERQLLEKIQAEQDKLKEIKRLQKELEEQEKVDSDDEDNDKHDLDFTDKTDQYYHKQDPYENRITEKTVQAHEPEYPKKVTKTPDNKSNVRVQPKKEKVAQVTINKPLTPDEDETEEKEPKEDFTAFYEQAAQADVAVDLRLTPCSICGRNFATDRLARHQKICNKNSKKTRKVFDVQKQRVAGLEHAKYVVTGQYKKEPPKPKKADWRVQHENFIKTIRYAKGASDEPPPVIENPHYVACPYCERKFNPETAERHIPRCKDIKARPAPPKNNNRRKR